VWHVPQTDTCRRRSHGVRRSTLACDWCLLRLSALPQVRLRSVPLPSPYIQ